MPGLWQWALLGVTALVWLPVPGGVQGSQSCWSLSILQPGTGWVCDSVHGKSCSKTTREFCSMGSSGNTRVYAKQMHKSRREFPCVLRK